MSQLVPASPQAVALAKERVTEDLVKNAAQYLEPLGIDPKFFSQAAVMAISKNTALLDCTPDSLKLSLMKCAQRGLMPDGESAALVPFGTEVSLIPMFGGMMDIVRRNLPGIAADASVVRTWDDFEILKGTAPRIEHAPKPLPADRNIPDLNNIEYMVGAYCIVRIPPYGNTEFTWMWKQEILRIRARVKSASKASSPWQAHTARMFEKTAIRAAFRRLPSRSQIFAGVQNASLDILEERRQPIDVTPQPAQLPSGSSIDLTI